jgi:predicted amidohydrolase
MTSGADKQKNIDVAVRWAREAKALGASFVGLPENVAFMGPEREKELAAEPLDGPTLSTFQGVAKELGVTLLAGSIPELGAPGGKLYNTSVLFGPGGERLGVYRKIHLFDVDVQDGATYRESLSMAPGNELSCVAAPFGKVGLSVCYDLRFPELYRALASEGAILLTVPSAFTLMTGKDHWEVLLRARAIENQAYVVAPAQVGRHSESRQTYGNAMVVDPWGAVTARASDGEGLALAQLDLNLLARIRHALPALSHRRLGLSHM